MRHIFMIMLLSQSVIDYAALIVITDRNHEMTELFDQDETRKLMDFLNSNDLERGEIITMMSRNMEILTGKPYHPTNVKEYFTQDLKDGIQSYHARHLLVWVLYMDSKICDVLSRKANDSADKLKIIRNYFLKTLRHCDPKLHKHVRIQRVNVSINEPNIRFTQLKMYILLTPNIISMLIQCLFENSVLTKKLHVHVNMIHSTLILN